MVRKDSRNPYKIHHSIGVKPMKIHVFLRFYEELNDFLHPENRKKTFLSIIDTPKTIKQLINSFGIPDVEVDLVLANSHSVPFSYLLKDGDYVSVYPKFESFDISSVTEIRNKPLRNLNFILDVHLGKLAKYLRMLGFDTLYQNNYTDQHLIRLSKESGRVLLTRDKALLNVKQVTRGYWVKNNNAINQIKEVVNRFHLLPLAKPFSRCLKCNAKVQNIDKRLLKNIVSPNIYSQYSEFSECTGCGNVFWKGSHYRSMVRFIEKLKKMDLGGSCQH